MRRRTFVASGLGLVASAAGQGAVWTFWADSAFAQPAVTPPATRNAPASAQGKWKGRVGRMVECRAVCRITTF